MSSVPPNSGPSHRPGRFTGVDVSELSDEEKIELIRGLPEPQREEFLQSLSSETQTQLLGLVSREYIETQIEELPIESLAKDIVRDEIRLMIQSESYDVINSEQLGHILADTELEVDRKDISTEDLSLGEVESGIMNQGHISRYLLNKALLERPAASLYAASIVFMMLALYSSSVILALAGGLTLLFTVLHYAR